MWWNKSCVTKYFEKHEIHNQMLITMNNTYLQLLVFFSLAFRMTAMDPWLISCCSLILEIAIRDALRVEKILRQKRWLTVYTWTISWFWSILKEIQVVMEQVHLMIVLLCWALWPHLLPTRIFHHPQLRRRKTCNFAIGCRFLNNQGQDNGRHWSPIKEKWKLREQEHMKDY